MPRLLRFFINHQLFKLPLQLWKLTSIFLRPVCVWGALLLRPRSGGILYLKLKTIFGGIPFPAIVATPLVRRIIINNIEDDLVVIPSCILIFTPRTVYEKISSIVTRWHGAKYSSINLCRGNAHKFSTVP